MIPFGTHNVTLIRRNERTDEEGRTRITYTKHILINCSWKVVEKRANDSGAFEGSKTVVCRVPKNALQPRIGDVLVRGEYLDRVESVSDVERLLEANSGTAFKVVSVADNSLNGILDHYACRGE